MTWLWQEDNPADERHTLLKLDFNELSGGTELILTHEQFATEESRASHGSGWEAILGQLQRVL